MRNKLLTLMAAALLVVGVAACGSGSVEFERYEVQRDTLTASGAFAGINVIIDIPKGGGSRQKNVEKAIREILSHSQLAGEVGEPKEEQLKEIVDDYVKRYLDYMASGEYGPMTCDLGVLSGYQNENSITLHFVDGIYGNGGPQEHDCVVRFSDGHIMQQNEMIQISDEDLKSLIESHGGEDIPLNLADGYNFSPAGEDSCKVLWPIGSHFFGEVMILISEIEPYLTEEGKGIFMTNSSILPTRKVNGEDSSMAAKQEDTSVEVGDVVRGELGTFELKGPVKECVWDYGSYKQTYTFDKKGMWTTRDGIAPWADCSSKRDEKGRIIHLENGASEEVFEYNEKGLRTVYAYHDMEYGYKTYYTYDENDEVVEVKDVNWFHNKESNPRVTKFKVLERDSHGNWTKRDIGSGVISTRQITYYE